MPPGGGGGEVWGENVNPHLSLICYVGRVKLVHQGQVRWVLTGVGLNYHP